jgi:hypothetical protein
MTMKNMLTASVGIVALVILVCVVLRVHELEQGLRLAGFLGIAGTVRVVCGSGGLDGRSSIGPRT